MQDIIPQYTIPEGENNRIGGFKIYALKSAKKPNNIDVSFPLSTNMPHRHTEYEICVFYSVNGSHELDFRSIPLKNNSLHIICPGQVHQLLTIDAEGYVIIFPREFMELKNLSGFGKVDNLPQSFLNLAENEFKKINKYLTCIINEYLIQREESEAIIKSLLNVVLLEMKAHFKNIIKQDNGIPSHHQKVLTQFKDLVEEEFRSNLLVKDYAKKLNLSASHLNKISKSASGKTANDIVIDRIILEAKRMLIFSTHSNKEIAFHLSFDDPSYFSRIFKKKTGYTPSAFRKKKLEMYQP